MSRENSDSKIVPQLSSKENREKRFRDVSSIHQGNKRALSRGAGSDRCDEHIQTYESPAKKGQLNFWFWMKVSQDKAQQK